MTIDLSGRVALVTGASSGIGEATARTLAGLGASVAINGRRTDRLQALAADLGEASFVVEGDLTDQAVAERVVDTVVRRFGRLDIVVNNAGYLQPGPSEAAFLEDWDRMIDVNVRAHSYVVRLTLPHLLEAARTATLGASDLVLIGSVSGRTHLAGSSVYNMTKWAVTGLGLSLREEYAAKNVRVSIVEPGVVSTELPNDIRPENAGTKPDPRWSGYDPLLAEDIADAVGYIVTRPRRASVNEIMIRPTNQPF